MRDYSVIQDSRLPAEAALLVLLMALALWLPGAAALPAAAIAALPAGASLALLAWTCRLSHLSATRSFALLCAAAIWIVRPAAAGLELDQAGSQIVLAAKCAACAFAAAGLAVRTRNPHRWD